MTTIPAEPLLTTFQKHIEDMRNLILCKVCIKPLYEPYIISCGHSFCYSCLTSWFGGSGATKKREKFCPDCRAVVTVQPAPNYILRELSHMFISRAELLPEDETTEEHEKGKQEETEQMTRDRNGPGLFEGAFKPGIHHVPGFALIPIRDVEDGVMRCPSCAWELEDGHCNQCGFDELNSDELSADDMSGMDESDDSMSVESLGSTRDPGPDESDLDHDIDEVDGDFDRPTPGYHLDHYERPGPGRPSSDNIPPHLLSYLDRSPVGHSQDDRSSHSRDSTPPAYNHYGGRVANSIDGETDYDEDDEEDEEMRGFVVNDDEIDLASNVDDHSTSRGSSVRASLSPYQRHARIVPSDEDSDSSSSETQDDHSDNTATLAPRTSRIINDDSDSTTDDSSEGASEDETPVPQKQPGGRRRPHVIVDSEDENEEEDTNFDVGGGNENENENENISRSLTFNFGQEPPQSRESRANHLNHQRAARGRPSSGSGSDRWHPYHSSARSPSVEMTGDSSNTGGSRMARRNPRSRPYSTALRA